jgi:putative protease
MPVFLIDRREKFLETQFLHLEQEIKPFKETPKSSQLHIKMPRGLHGKKNPKYVNVYRELPRSPARGCIGIWLSETLPEKLSGKQAARIWWWLPPVIWPEEENRIRSSIDTLINRGAKTFVLNAPWQAALFLPAKNFILWAGPFCNAGNPLNFDMLKMMGFKGVIVSPELGGRDFLRLPEQSPILLGIILWGNWPLCISRNLSSSLKPDKFFESPKKENAWIHSYDNHYWIFPEWYLDLSHKKDELTKAGYSLFVKLNEPIPEKIKIKKRPGLWNWDIGLK